MSVARPILEYESAYWDPCREGQINALERVQKKSAQFTNHTTDSDELGKLYTTGCKVLNI